MRAVQFLLLIALVGCASNVPDQLRPINKWSDPNSVAILDAQERRDTPALCTFLSDTSEAVRSAAALAFASVQDTLAIDCLLKAFGDPSEEVRLNAVFAMGFVADSVSLEAMADLGRKESDPSVQKACSSAVLLAMQRNNMLGDPRVLFDLFARSSGQDRMRIADAFRRLPDTVLAAVEADYLDLISAERKTEVKALLIRGLEHSRSAASKESLERNIAMDQPDIVRVNALRTLAKAIKNESVPELLNALPDKSSMVRTAAVEALLDLPEPVRQEQLRNAEVDLEDPMTWIPIYGLVLRSASNEEEAKDFRGKGENANPYTRSLLLKARASASGSVSDTTLYALLEGDSAAILRQAAFESLVRRARDMMKRSRYATPEAQFAQLGSVIRRAMVTGDPGLIATACEILLAEEGDSKRWLVTMSDIQRARKNLHQISDLEATRLLSLVEADLSPDRSFGEWPSIPFNHPIDPVKLRVLKQGQRYRVVTSKGEIILTTDVNECPGSSLAFDSLVTAGYYNGKAFHRMVPNFVVQGGCPRGDGYGGMPWTLRTEIGRTPFTAGSVGLASAGRDTESCQFFITHSATPHLDGRYTRFGEVVSGMDVVMKLQVGDVMERVERVE